MSNDSATNSIRSAKLSGSSNSSGAEEHDPMNITDYHDTITAKDNILLPTFNGKMKGSPKKENSPVRSLKLKQL